MVINLLDRSGDEISADELDDLEEEKEGEWNEELLGMTDDQDDPDPAIMLISNNATPSHSASWIFKQDD